MSVIQVYLKDIWKKTLEFVKEEGPTVGYDSSTFNTFFADSSLYDLTDDKAVVAVDSFLAASVIKQDILFLKECIKKVIEREVECEVVLRSDVKKIVTIPSTTLVEEVNEDNINVNYTFDNFVVGPSNKESHAAALACALKPGKFYNPLFIFGNSGLGKTHLLHSIGNYVKKNLVDKRVMYISSTDFVSDVVNTIKNNSIEEYKSKLNKVDVLLVDDIQFLAGKEKSHEVFFSIFNELVNNRKQIVLTSDRHPTEIKGLEERLISRFSSGLSVGVDSPEFETSLAILKKKIEHQSLDPGLFDDDALSYIATHYNKDVRSLEGALNRVIFCSIMSNTSGSDRIDFITTLNAFKGQSFSDNKNEITVNSIKKAVADYYGLTRQQLVSKTRTKNIASARHIAMYLCRKHLDLPFLRIGEEFGKRDHSTVINACEKIEASLQKDISFKIAIQEIEKMFINS